MKLTLPLPMEDPKIAPVREDPLDSDEDFLEEVATQMLEHRKAQASIQSVIEVIELNPELGDRVRQLTAEIHQDFAGTVLRSDVPREWIHKRGPTGEVRIILKPGSRPKTSHLIRMIGEKF